MELSTETMELLFTYIRNNLEYSGRIVPIGQTKALELDLILERKRIKITAIYRSPQCCPKTFNKDLSDYIGKINTHDYHVIIGDININLLANNEIVDEYKNILSFYGYKSYVNNVTRPSGGSCIDHIFLRYCQPIPEQTKSFIVRTDVTDHYTILLCLDFMKIPPRKNKIRYKEYMNYKRLRDDLGKVDWKELIKDREVDIVAELFMELLKK